MLNVISFKPEYPAEPGILPRNPPTLIAIDPQNGDKYCETWYVLLSNYIHVLSNYILHMQIATYIDQLERNIAHFVTTV